MFIIETIGVIIIFIIAIYLITKSIKESESGNRTNEDKINKDKPPTYNSVGSDSSKQNYGSQSSKSSTPSNSANRQIQNKQNSNAVMPLTVKHGEPCPYCGGYVMPSTGECRGCGRIVVIEQSASKKPKPSEESTGGEIDSRIQNLIDNNDLNGLINNIHEYALNTYDNKSSITSGPGVAVRYGDTKDVIVTKRKIIDNFSEYEAGLIYSVANQCAYSYKFDLAVSLYEEAIRIHKDPSFYNNMASTLKRMGKYEDALIAYIEALKIDPEYNIGYFRLAILIKAYNLSYSVPPENLMLEYYRRNGNSFGPVDLLLTNLPEEEKIAFYAIVNDLDIKPSGDYFEAKEKTEDKKMSSQYWSDKGSSMHDLQRYYEAIVCFNKAIEIEPNDITAWMNKGSALIEINKYQEALDCYDRALKIKPNFDDDWPAIAWFLKANALMFLSRFNEALGSINRALELEPNLSEARQLKQTIQQQINIASSSSSVSQKKSTYQDGKSSPSSQNIKQSKPVSQTSKSNPKQTVTKSTELPSSIIGKDGAPMVLIPAGEFQMGSNDGEDDEKPVHTVFINAFYMDKHEVTNAQYKKFMDATGRRAPYSSCFRSEPNFNAPDQPVVGVSWEDAVAYADWAGKRLPTDAEWEKAARGGLEGKKYPWGDELTHDNANYDGTGGRDIWEYTSPVGSFAPNGYGLYDMAGNVCEWCADWYDSDYYTGYSCYNKLSSKSNPTGPSENTDIPQHRVIRGVIRGGSWSNATRDHASPSVVCYSVGFRCVQDIPK